MTEYKIENGALKLEVEGADRLWALRSHLTIPLADITGVRGDQQAVEAMRGGIKLAGSRIPGVLQAGFFHDAEGTVFWDVHRPGHAVVISLQHEHYRALVVDVENPDQAVAEIRQAIAS